MTEARLQTEIVSALRKLGLLVVHVPNGGSREGGRIEGARFKALGVVAGFPDLMVLRSGRAFFLEVKTEAGSLSPAQARFLETLAQNSFPCAVVRTVEDAVAAVRGWAAP